MRIFWNDIRSFIGKHIDVVLEQFGEPKKGVVSSESVTYFSALPASVSFVRYECYDFWDEVCRGVWVSWRD